MKANLLSLLALLPVALAVPTSLTKRQDTTKYCGQWDTATEGNYELLLDQWGISGATGSQCAQVTSLSGSNIAWTTTWTWSGGNGVKSFTNIQLNEGVNVPLSSISSMPVSPQNSPVLFTAADFRMQGDLGLVILHLKQFGCRCSV